MTQEQINDEALRLHTAEQERRQVDPTTLTFPDMEIEDAYQIQKAWKAIKLGLGRSVVGHKIGLTSRVMQVNMGIDEPDFGFLLDDMVFEEGSTIKASDFLDPKIEVELAFILKKELKGENLSIEEVLDATEYVMPALELIAARTFRVHPETGRRRTVRDTISDNAANAGIILGGKKVQPREIDLRWVGALMSKNDVIEESGVSGAVLNHPANGIAWLAKRYAAHGVGLEPGQIILAGSFTRPIDVAAGDSIVVDYGELGTISCFFD